MEREGERLCGAGERQTTQSGGYLIPAASFPHLICPNSLMPPVLLLPLSYPHLHVLLLLPLSYPHL